MKGEILEYFEGTPDNIYDTEKEITWRWYDTNAFPFGFFPIDLDGNYEFMYGKFGETHLDVAKEAALKLIGKAKEHIEDVEFWDVRNECYSKSYCRGRFWHINSISNKKHPSLLAFWKLPSSKMLCDIADRLSIDKNKTIIITTDASYDEKAKNITVADYIKNRYSGDDGQDEMNLEFDISQKLVDRIRYYNQNAQSWQGKKEREGWKTLAQRNATIYQEEKEPKDIIKENNMKENKYQKEFSNYIEIMNEALKRNDFKAYKYAKNMLDESVNEAEENMELLGEMKTSNFGILNHIFESQLPMLLKSNKKAVRNVIKLIKEDKNLLGQFNFYNAIKTQYKGKTANLIESKDALDKLVEASLKSINQNTVKDSNKRLRKVMVENGIVPTELVDGEDRKLYESGHRILTSKNTAANAIPLMESYHVVCEYMDKNKGKNVNESKSMDELVREFEDKLKMNLNESEVSFVQQITDFRTPIAEKRKESLFNKLKNECVDKINSMLKEDTNNDELKDLSKKINEMSFNKETIVSDVAKLLEIRDILMDD